MVTKLKNVAQIALRCLILAVASGTNALAIAGSTEQIWTTQSDKFGYHIQARSQAAPVGVFHDWQLTATDHGQPVDLHRVRVEARMPAHGHGTNSQAVALESDQRFTTRISGIRFNMPGNWQVKLQFTGPAGLDTATFNIQVHSSNPPSIHRPTPEAGHPAWSTSQVELLTSLSLAALPEPKDSSNQWIGSPDAIALGKRLFHDPGLSRSGLVSCSSCHQAAWGYGDYRPLSFGSALTQRHSPSLLGTAHASWWYWDGARDSLWSQALTPIERAGEMDNTRTKAVHYLLHKSPYNGDYHKLTGAPQLAMQNDRFPLSAGPNATAPGRLLWHRMRTADKNAVNAHFVNIGKLIAAFESTLQHTASRVDHYIETVRNNGHSTKLTPEEVAGLNLFLNIEKTQCMRCHNGPLYSNQDFQNIGTGVGIGGFDFGRARGLQEALNDPFNCFGEHANVPREQCQSLRFAKKLNRANSLNGAFKVPTLRNLQQTAPYFHDGRFETLEQVLAHYARVQPSQEIQPIVLSSEEQAALLAFLRAL